MKKKVKEEYGKQQMKRYEQEDQNWSTDWSKFVDITFKTKPYLRDQLKIQLYYHNLKQGDFFRSVVRAVVNNDPDIIKFLDKIKKINTVLPMNRIEKQQESFKRQKYVAQEFDQEVLSEDEIDEIFDILEVELSK